jgi:hypothetical protein
MEVSMAETSSKDFATIALDVAMKCVALKTLPWTTRPRDLAKLKKAFKKDFETQVQSLGSFMKWRSPIERLFSHVGAMAAFLAEARQKSVSKDPGQVTWKDLIWACRFVKSAICRRARPGDRRPLEPTGMICTMAPGLSDGEMVAVREAMAALRRLIRS